MRAIVPFVLPVAAIAVLLTILTTRERESHRREEAAAAERTAAAEAARPVRGHLTYAPEVPLPTERTRAAHVVIDVEIKEVTLPIANGTTYTFWTFGGHVPGQFIRVRQGDTVELHLKNAPNNKMPLSRGRNLDRPRTCRRRSSRPGERRSSNSRRRYRANTPWSTTRSSAPSTRAPSARSSSTARRSSRSTARKTGRGRTRAAPRRSRPTPTRPSPRAS